MKPRCRSHILWRSLGALLLSLAALRSHAADVVWISTSGNWTVAGNWSPSQVPGPADNVFITNSGTFAAVNGLRAANGIVLVPRYSSTNLTLVAGQEPALTGAARTGNEFRFDVLTTSGFTYQAEYTDSLNAPVQWTPFGMPFTGTGGKVAVIDSPVAVPQRFFRVQMY